MFISAVSLLLCLNCSSLWDPWLVPNELSLIAGALGGVGHADDTGVAARFSTPYGLALDHAGNLFLMDTDNTIRKIVASTGVVTTLAGTAGMTGSVDGSGRAARFNLASGVAVDGAGNLFVADQYNHTIRKVVTSTGAVTTLAGTAGMSGSNDGSGTTARFNLPFGVAVDDMGNLFVADSGNHTIRKVVTSTGVVTTMAGMAGAVGSTDGTGAAARFRGPAGMAVDGAGNLFVTELSNHTIRQVVTSTGVVTTLAGTAGMAGSTDGTGAAARFNAPRFVAVDGVGNLFVADTSNNTIRKVVTSTGVVTTLAGTAGMRGGTDGTGAAARFDFSTGVAVDGAGNLFVADGGNSTVRKVVTSTGVVTTLAGTADMSGNTDGTVTDARLDQPSGVAVDGAGNLFVADLGNNTIRKVATSTGVVTTLAGSGKQGTIDGTGAAAQFFQLAGVAVDGAGSLFVADYGSSTIRQVVTSTGVVTTLAGAAETTGSADGTGAAARFYEPYGMAVDGAGNLYVADCGNSTIRQIVTSTGVVTTLAGAAGMLGSADGTGTAARFYYPCGVAVDGAGNLYVADTFNHTIRKIVLSTGEVTTLAGTAGMVGSADGSGPAARFNRPYDVAADSAGNLYVADTDNSTIRKIEVVSATVTTIIGVPGQRGVKLGTLPGRLNRPNGVAVSSTDKLFIVDSAENAVLSVQ